jgi:hypothetical protein
MRAGEDTVANQRMWNLGHRAYREGAIELSHRSPCSTRRRLVKHHYLRGRAYGRILRDGFGGGRGRSSLRARVSLLARYPRRRLEMTDERVEEWGDDLAPEYERVRGLVILGILAAWAGAGTAMFSRGRSAT